MTTTDIATFRVRKREARATLTLADGRTVRGAFFLSETAAGHAGPERIDEVLNAATRFVPFHVDVDVDADTGRHDRPCRPECDFPDRIARRWLAYRQTGRAEGRRQCGEVGIPQIGVNQPPGPDTSFPNSHFRSQY